jgi:hypothetical protein
MPWESARTMPGEDIWMILMHSVNCVHHYKQRGDGEPVVKTCAAPRKNTGTILRESARTMPGEDIWMILMHSVNCVHHYKQWGWGVWR